MKWFSDKISSYRDQIISALGVVVAFLVFVIMLAVGGCFWRDDSARMAYHSKRYSSSVAFVAVEYILKDRGTVVQRFHTEGTAFLADSEGRLLTNRHVACPWLNNKELDRKIAAIKNAGGKPALEYRIWLWFGGVRALRHRRSEFENSCLEDAYYGYTAYRSDGVRKVSIAGVLPVSEKKDNNDFAVLQVTPVPEKIEAIPLDTKNVKLAQLTPLMTLGFPMGTEVIPGSRAVASASMGHVRRSFDHSIQADLSVHSGNSGGPVINLSGRVVGIATSVCSERGLFLLTRVSDMANIITLAPGIDLLKKVEAGIACNISAQC